MSKWNKENGLVQFRCPGGEEMHYGRLYLAGTWRQQEVLGQGQGQGQGQGWYLRTGTADGPCANYISTSPHRGQLVVYRIQERIQYVLHERRRR